jgi:RNA polymerase sigma factor (sigma-70 family)
MESIIKGN